MKRAKYTLRDVIISTSHEVYQIHIFNLGNDLIYMRKYISQDYSNLQSLLNILTNTVINSLKHKLKEIPGASIENQLDLVKFLITKFFERDTEKNSPGLLNFQIAKKIREEVVIDITDFFNENANIEISQDDVTTLLDNIGIMFINFRLKLEEEK